jgi:hypothetical protein
MTRTLVEARGVIVESADGGLAVQYITPGVGSSGYYSPDVLSEAAGSGLFPAGMHLYIDHPSATDRSNRPERSVRDIGGISTSAGVWNEESQAVEANIKILEAHSWLKDPDLRSAIGLSIRASGSVTEGTIGGRKMPVVEKLEEVMSVDFVTHAGRGGRILEARVTDAMLETSANDRREQLSTAIRDAYATSDNYPYVLDYDEAAGIVYFDVESASVGATYSQAYTASDVGVSLTDSRVEVRRVTNYVPVRAGTDETTEGETVPDAPELVEAQTKLTEAQRENETLKAENAALKESAAKRDLTDAASKFAAHRVAEAKVTPLMASRIVAEAMRDISITDAGSLDEAEFGKRIDKARDAEVEYAKQFTASPTMTGGGHTGTVQESEPYQPRAWGRTTVKGA